MKFLFLTAALVHCASAMNGSGSPRPPSNPTARTIASIGCGNVGAAQLTEEQARQDFEILRKKQGPTWRHETTSDSSDSPRGLDEEEKDMELTLVACDKCQDCPTTPNKKDPSQLQYDDSKNCRKCYNPQTGRNNHYVEAPCRECNGTGQMPGLQCDVCNGSGKYMRTIRKGLVYNMSVMVQAILELDEGTTRIPCKEVDAETLNYICEYLRMVNGRTPKQITKPIRTKDIVQCVHEHDRADGEWIEGIYTNPEVDGKEVVFDIMLAANSMDIQPLLHLGACKIATLIKGQSPEAIKEILGGDAAAGHRRRRLQKLFRSF